MTSFLFTSESVSSGHPDKICDQISDAILDQYLSLDNNARSAIETFVTKNNVIVGGEIRAPIVKKSHIDDIIRSVIYNIGYKQKSFHYNKVKITNLIHEQSRDIALGVDNNDITKEGAGDQGIMFGYACDDNTKYMPSAIYYANKIIFNIMKAVAKGNLEGLGPDGKSQVTLLYKDKKPIKAHSILISIQHQEDILVKDIKKMIYPYVIQSLPKDFMCDENQFLVNPTGKFVIGGPESDVGLTGRKIIVDTYGGYAPHGGGAFSGKDPSKVDRSAAYMARYIAKNVVAAKLAKECTIQLSYAIGIPEPISFYIKTSNSKIDHKKLSKKIQNLIDLSPYGIRKYLKLNAPIYKKTSCYGHFGRTPEKSGSFSWEKLELSKELKSF